MGAGMLIERLWRLAKDMDQPGDDAFLELVQGRLEHLKGGLVRRRVFGRAQISVEGAAILYPEVGSIA